MDHVLPNGLIFIDHVLPDDLSNLDKPLKYFFFSGSRFEFANNLHNYVGDTAGVPLVYKNICTKVLLCQILRFLPVVNTTS